MRDSPPSPPIIATTSTVGDLHHRAQLRARPNTIYLDLTTGIDPIRVPGQPGRGKHIGGL
ncbi:hypothetical protein EB73_34750 [Mycobacterium sp. SWH-M3]|nr:hypothetical protein EB73_34750 [Mycobacterium sp. SWH-M3]